MGRRAYKVPGKDGSRAKPKLLAFVHEKDGGKAIGVQFKLKPDRAKAVIAERDWIDRHPWDNLGSSGWLAARVTQKRQIAALGEVAGGEPVAAARGGNRP